MFDYEKSAEKANYWSHAIPWHSRLLQKGETEHGKRYGPDNAYWHRLLCNYAIKSEYQQRQ